MEPTVLKQHDILIVTAPPSLTDSDLANMRDALLRKARDLRSRGAVLDLSALDVLDSFACRSLQVTAQALRLEGAEAIVVGIRPELALAMAQMGLSLKLKRVRIALDLEEALEYLDDESGSAGHVE